MSQVGVLLHFFGPLYVAWMPIPCANFFAHVFFKTRLSSKSLEPLIETF